MWKIKIDWSNAYHGHISTMKTVRRTPSGYHVILFQKHSIGGHPVCYHVIVTAKVGIWEEFHCNTHVLQI